MNETITTNGMRYQEFKEKLGTELREHVEGFVRIGYLLKVARDTEILAESGYSNMEEFARAEYGLSKDVVSRYIAINDRFSVGGNSDRLKDEFKLYGVAKLSEMLTLSDEIIESMSPQMTRKEIQEIKKEVKSEKEITDIEVYLEPKQEIGAELGYHEKVFLQYFSDRPTDFIRIQEDLQPKNFLEVLAPSGVAMLTTRIPGTGKILISVRGLDFDIDIINARTNEKDSITWENLKEIIEDIVDPMQEAFDKEIQKEESKAQEEIEEVVHESKKEIEQEEAGKKEVYGGKEEVAPVQLLGKTEKKEEEEETEKKEEEKESEDITTLERKIKFIHDIDIGKRQYDIVSEKENIKVGDTIAFRQSQIDLEIRVRVVHITNDAIGLCQGFIAIGFEKIKKYTSADVDERK